MRTQTPIEVDEGEIEVTGRTADVVHRYKRLALIEVHLGSKWAETLASGNDEHGVPILLLVAGNRTRGGVDELKGLTTNVCLSAWAGWTIVAARVSRYTLVVCMTKREES